MKILGLTIIKTNELNKTLADEKSKAIGELVELLRKKDSIYLEPVKIIGDNLTVVNCAFIGGARGEPMVSFEESKNNEGSK